MCAPGSIQSSFCLDEALVGKAEVTAVADDDVIEQRDTKNLAGVVQSSGYLSVLRAGDRIA